MKNISAFAVALFLSATACAGATSSTDPRSDEREFSTSLDPGAVILDVGYRGGLTGEQPRFHLYGDGRLTILVSAPGRAEASESYSQHLSQQEVRSLVALAVDHGLMDVSGAALYSRMQTDSDGKFSRGVIDDAAEMSVRVELESYTVNDQPVEGRNLLQVEAPSLLLKLFPEYEELRGLAALDRSLRERLRQARRPAENGGS